MAENLTESNQPVSERQRAMEVQLRELAEAVKALEARLAEVSHPAATAAVTSAVQQEQEKVTPETLVVIAAAVTAFLAKRCAFARPSYCGRGSLARARGRNRGAPRCMARIIRG